MFKPNISGHNTIWGGTKIFGGTAPWLRACVHYLIYTIAT